MLMEKKDSTQQWQQQHDNCGVNTKLCNNGEENQEYVDS